MSEWRECKLGDISEITSSKRIFYSDYVSEGIPFWRSKEVIEKFNRKVISTDLFITPEKYFEIKNKFGVPQPNDILLTSVGTLGIPYLVEDHEPFYFKDGNLTWIRNIDEEKLHPKYLYKWLASQNGRDSLGEITIGSTQEALTIIGLKNLNLLLPPLEEQKAITEVLSSLDDKIDLLHRQNKTLEELAQTLFRQWFIEEVKDDWEVGTLDEILTVKGGTTPSTKNSEFWNGDICWSTPKDLSTNSDMYLFDTARKITKVGLSKIGSGLLPKGTVLLSSRAPVGYLAISGVPLAINQGYIAILDDKGFSKYFIFLWLKLNLEYIISNANGSTFLEISKTVFKSLDIIKPPEELRKKFDEVVIENFEKIKANTKQIKTLENMRDTLLPKLMSGEVRVEYGQ